MKTLIATAILSAFSIQAFAAAHIVDRAREQEVFDQNDKKAVDDRAAAVSAQVTGTSERRAVVDMMDNDILNVANNLRRISSDDRQHQKCGDSCMIAIDGIANVILNHAVADNDPVAIANAEKIARDIVAARAVSDSLDNVISTVSKADNFDPNELVACQQ